MGRKDEGVGVDGENNSSTQETRVHALLSVCVCSQRSVRVFAEETVGEV